jgi:hypothetical protein
VIFGAKPLENTADFFKGLKVKIEQVPLKPLLKGEFPSKAEQPFQQEARHLSREEAPGRGGFVVLLLLTCVRVPLSPSFPVF